MSDLKLWSKVKHKLTWKLYVFVRDDSDIWIEMFRWNLQFRWEDMEIVYLYESEVELIK